MTATLNLAAPVSPAAAAASGLKKIKVWLVDDNEQLRKLIGQLLGLEADIECARQFSSPDALLSTLASRPGPDVILLDVQMGDHNGIDAVRPIKSLTPTTRVLMFTSCFDPVWRQRALSEGASDYLLKTRGLDEVAARIRCPERDANPLTRWRRRPQRESSASVVVPNSEKQMRTSWAFTRTIGKLKSWWN